MDATLNTQPEGCFMKILKAIGIIILLYIAYFVVCWIFNSPGFAP